MSFLTPVYVVRFSGSSGWSNIDFGLSQINKLVKLSVKPGLTSAIGSFELTIPDTGSSGEGFKGIVPYSDVYIWYGYNNTGSIPDLRGKIETIKSELGDNGWVRTIIGRDYGEALFRILERQSYTGSVYNTVVALKDKAGLGSANTYISSSATAIPTILSNDNCFKGIEELSNSPSIVSNTNTGPMDFYVDQTKLLHWFPRQTSLGTQTFLVGTNIFSYKYFNDLGESKNQYYVFGMRNSNGTTGSDIPTDHDSYTEPGTPDWTSRAKSGSNDWETITVIGDNSLGHATGSNAIWSGIGIGHEYESLEMEIKKAFPAGGRILINDGDILHLYHGVERDPLETDPFEQRVRLETDANNYFECKLETTSNSWYADSNRIERSLNLGPTSEGISVTGAADTKTGSYRWTRYGSPDWYNINSFVLYQSSSNGPGPVDIAVDGLYIGTRFQFQTGSVLAQNAFGLRDAIVIDEKINSTDYCRNVAISLLQQNSGSIVQVELYTTGSPALQLGWQYALTLPAEGISAQNYTLIDLEHIIGEDGFTTKCLFTDKKEVRVPIPIINYPITRAREKRRYWMYEGKPWWWGGYF